MSWEREWCVWNKATEHYYSHSYDGSPKWTKLPVLFAQETATEIAKQLRALDYDVVAVKQGQKATTERSRR